MLYSVSMNTHRYARHLLILVALSLLVFVAVRIYLNRPATVVQSSKAPQLSPKNDLEMTDVSFTETEDGIPIWSLEASRANYRKSGQTIDLEDVAVVFYGSDKSIRSRLTAEKATADLESRQVVAQDQVVLNTAEGGQLKTDWLQYLHQQKSLSTDRKVVFNHLGARIEGVGMTYNLNDKRLTLESSVSAKVPFDFGR